MSIIEKETRMNDLIHDIQKVCKLTHIRVNYSAQSELEHCLLNLHVDYDPNEDIIESMHRLHEVYLHDIDRDNSFVAGIFDFSKEYAESLGIDLERYKFGNVFYIFYVLDAIGCVDMLEHAAINPTKTVELCKSVKIIISLISSNNMIIPPNRKHCGLYQYEALYARQYAYRMFPIVWNALKDKYDYYFIEKENENG